MKKLRVENSSLKEELEVKDKVIRLLMSRLKDAAVSLPPVVQESGDVPARLTTNQ